MPSTPIVATQDAFVALGERISRDAGVLDGLHGYFVQHAPRVHKACVLFNLLQRSLGDVLEVGPFFSYTPFLLHSHSRSYTILEADDPAVGALKPVYKTYGIKYNFLDLFDSFGPTSTAEHRLPFADASFDTVLCWETMEHFNFNPVKFVREILRVLRPGGSAHITVPNRASLQNIFRLISGRAEREAIGCYYQFEDYLSAGKKAFYGFHWREYSAVELELLFSRAGFVVRDHGTFVGFQAHSNVSLTRSAVRRAYVQFARIFPRYGTHVHLTGNKPRPD